MLTDIFNLSLAKITLRMTVPILLAALGGIFTAQVNIFNIALEGMMLIGAFFAVVGSFYTGSALGGVVGAVLAGLGVSCIFGLFCVKLKSNPIVVGFALNFLIAGLSVILLREIFNVRGFFQSERITLLPIFKIPLIKNLPVLGPIISGHNVIFYSAYILVPVVSLLLYRTSLGLRIRAVGEHITAVKATGIGTVKYQYIAILLSGILSGLAGAYLSLSSLGMFTENISAGRGIIALAAIFFGKGIPWLVFFGCLVFGFTEALAIQFQGMGIPTQLVLMLPYLATILALLSTAKRQK